ncbi:hypothetical protein ST47_g3072 [Ascochyta rabiei]|uniref:Uncharacterized protein n=1 Tax=Didymella rabiei TaxID=5454 RepID=A0A163IHU9_DIDRA|nr:hypothetical protein ST47_g3072 [Ascochyta rabiei]
MVSARSAIHTKSVSWAARSRAKGLALTERRKSERGRHLAFDMSRAVLGLISHVLHEATYSFESRSAASHHRSQAKPRRERGQKRMLFTRRIPFPGSEYIDPQPPNTPFTPHACTRHSPAQSSPQHMSCPHPFLAHTPLLKLTHLPIPVAWRRLQLESPQMIIGPHVLLHAFWSMLTQRAEKEPAGPLEREVSRWLVDMPAGFVWDASIVCAGWAETDALGWAGWRRVRTRSFGSCLEIHLARGSNGDEAGGGSEEEGGAVHDDDDDDVVGGGAAAADEGFSKALGSALAACLPSLLIISQLTHL